MTKPSRRDVDAWSAELGREMHAVHSERQLTPNEMRGRLAAIEKQMAALPDPALERLI